MAVDSGDWKFFRFGLLVTGEGEVEFAPSFFRSLMESGRCTFEVIRKIEQRSPITSAKRRLEMVGTGKTIPNRDETAIGIPARNYLQRPDTFVIILDDLEKKREPDHAGVFARYRQALDTILPPHMRYRASVHFFVFMIEAYYFANAIAVNKSLGTELTDYVGDVEAIGHPKNKLKKLVPGFDEKSDGAKIVPKLDLRHILSNRETCRSLRSLFRWCTHVLGEAPSDDFQLLEGQCCPITDTQIENDSLE